MKYKKPKKTVKSGPEATGAKRFIRHMVARGWTCMKIGGGKFTIGWPDYYCHHPYYGHRWVEAKKPGGLLRESQIKRFTQLNKAGDHVFILRDERDYMKLFKKDKYGKLVDNWGDYLKWPK